MRPYTHFNLNIVKEFLADKATILSLMATSAAAGRPLSHFDIRSPFMSESYYTDTPLFVKQMPLFNGLFIDPNKPIDQLRLNAYGTNTAVHIFHKRLLKPLRAHSYHQSLANPCSSIQHSPEGPILIGFFIDDSLVSARNTWQIDEFGDILRKKCAVQDLCNSSIFIGWNIIRDGPHSIRISQLNLIKKSIARASLTHTQ